MKTWKIVVLGLIGGVALGAGSATARFKLAKGDPNLSELWGPDPNGGVRFPPEGAPQPKAVVDSEHFDFGKMERGALGSHTFVLTNAGEGPLSLKQGETTCKCTISKLKDQSLAPGESVDVTLEWEAKSSTGSFRQSATVYTNDPGRPRVILTITGQLTQATEVRPHSLVFSKLMVDEAKTAEVRLFSFSRSDLEVLSHSFSEPDSAECFEAEFEPLPAAEIASAQAQSGFLIRVTAQPGMPVGPIRQRLVLELNVEGMHALAIPIDGYVSSHFSIVGRPGWSSETNVLYLDIVKSAEGIERELTIYVRGSDAGDTQITVGQVTPEFLEVTLGEPKPGPNLVAIPLRIRVPPGAPVVNHLGTAQGELAEVQLETNHPLVKRLRMNVKFAVEK